MQNPLAEYRQIRGISQQELAAELNISRQMVGMLETGARPFTVNMVRRIEDRLGIKRSKLLPFLFSRAA